MQWFLKVKGQKGKYCDSAAYGQDRTGHWAAFQHLFICDGITRLEICRVRFRCSENRKFTIQLIKMCSQNSSFSAQHSHHTWFLVWHTFHFGLNWKVLNYTQIAHSAAQCVCVRNMQSEFFASKWMKCHYQNYFKWNLFLRLPLRFSLCVLGVFLF